MPTLQEKKEYIEQKIKEANPELTKLEKFSTIVYKNKDLCGDGMGYVLNYNERVVRENPDINNMLIFDFILDKNVGINKERDIVEIIGKEIQLHHVLLAIEEKCKINSNWQPQIDSIMNLLLPVYKLGVLQHDRYWDLTHPYNNQKPEVYEFLYQIMNK